MLSRSRLRSNVQIIFFHGVTGVGKTTVIKRTCEDLLRFCSPAAEQDPNLVPVIYVKAWRPESGLFSWHGFYCDILKALDQPHIDKMAPGDGDDHCLRNRGKSAREMRQEALSSLKQHTTQVICVDEAQHMQSVASAKVFVVQLDILKSLADETGALVILVGPFELVRFLELSPQLARRSDRYYFGRYLPYDPIDRQEFTDVVASLTSLIPLPKPANLLEHVPYLYEGSLGLVGALKNWIERALLKALDRNASQLSLTDLQASIMPISARLKIATELNDVENEEANEEANQPKLRELLGITKVSSTSKPSVERNGKAKRAVSVGERKPERDPVGQGECESVLT